MSIVNKPTINEDNHVLHLQWNECTCDMADGHQLVALPKQDLTMGNHYWSAND